ncbi:MAG TPA: LemA family protein [Longimicrobiales bacterium]|nr:LemA family protein [Longimicrobiales bacterium]
MIRQGTLAAAAILALAGSLTGCGYNRIQELDERAEMTRANIDTELVRRNDLIPNLVATVDEAARFEQQTQVGVAEARSGLTAAREQMSQALQSDDADAIAAADAQVQDNLRSFISISVEAYPELRANESFLRLQDELTETENRLNVARRDYNESVTQYNTYIRRFPYAITARVIGADRRTQFVAPEGTQAAPQVEFNR